ncbi:MAG: hypothetical protein M3O50_21685 [Myxococcota bacterium]|nr:hypothetical protein [Myxococcota bacterium]
MRQAFALSDLQGKSLTPAPTVAYDPVARIVTIAPTAALQSDQMYRLSIGAGTNGVHAIDGATLGASSLCATRTAQQCIIEFPVVAATSSATQSQATVEFCRDIYPIFSRCGGSGCHGGKLPASGLLLDLPKNITATAIGRVAHGSNTGPRSEVQSPGDPGPFGIDMAIVDPGPGSPAAGDPSQSWLLYKVMMGAPASQSGAQASSCDGGVASPTDVTTIHSLAWQPLSDAERNALANLVIGREMPIAPAGTAAGQGAGNLTLAELERISRWIAQSAPVPSTCGDCVP